MAKQNNEDTVLEKAPVSSKKTITENKKITLRAIYGKQAGNVKLRPAFDRNTGRILTGQELMTDEEKKKHLAIVVDENTTVTLFDNVVFDLNHEVNAINWAWVKHHPYVAKDFETAQSQPSALFYIEDLEAEMDKKATKREKIYDALRLIKEASDAKRKEIMRLLGTKTEHYSGRHVNDFLEDLAFNKPERILEAFADKNYKERLFLYSLIDKKIVKVEKGLYKYNDISLGLTEEQAVEWMKASKNAEIVSLMKEML